MLPERDVAAVRLKEKPWLPPGAFSLMGISPTSPTRPFGVIRKAVSRASSRFRPVPACAIPTSSSNALVSNIPSAPLSSVWLLARLTIVMPIARMSAAAAFGDSSPPKGPVKRGRSAMDDSALAKPTSESLMIFSRLWSRGSSSGTMGAIAPKMSPTAASVNGASIFICSSRAGSRVGAAPPWPAPLPCPPPLPCAATV